MGELNGSRILCGDCNAPDPEWASINRGLLLCNDCCFIHRSLGPEYSVIKSLKEGEWNVSLLSLVTTLASGSANHVWEHLLFDRSKTERGESLAKKPFPYDTLETKRKFIQMKHFLFQFIPRTTPDQIEVKSQELHSTVRTASVDTTLRLLAGGADPNYFHPEKGTRPLHVAARNGQALQIELLHLYGAHSAAPDYLGQTPMEHAIAAGHKDLAQRILQLRYSLTDQLTHFVCHEMPDHTSMKHIIVPNMPAKSPRHEVDINNLPSYLLEQLSADLLDEVGRRQIEKLVHAKFGNESCKFSIAFLPVNPHYPSVRNQARQKFARLTDSELSSMISLVLTESEKRHWNGSPGGDVDGGGGENIFIRKSTPARIMNNNNGNGYPLHTASLLRNVATDDDYPLYDSVASDEDLVLAEQQAFLAEEKSKFDPEPEKSPLVHTPTLPNSLLVSTTTPTPTSTEDNDANVTILMKRMLVSNMFKAEQEIEVVMDKNRTLEREVVTLQEIVQRLLKENMKTLPYLNWVKKLQEQSQQHNRNLPLLQQPRPSSMCEFVNPASSSPTNTTTNLLGDLHPPPKENNNLIPFTLLAEQVTGQTVRLVKKLIDFATSLNLQELQLVSEQISALVNNLIQKLLEIIILRHDPKVMECLEKLRLHILSMDVGISLLISNLIALSSGREQRFVVRPQDLNPSVTTFCLDVCKALKQLLACLTLADKKRPPLETTTDSTKT